MKKRQFGMISLVLAIMIFVNITVYSETLNNVSTAQTAWRAFYVSTTGNDNNSGAQDSPFKTIEKAQMAVQAITSSMQGDIVVNIKGGYYFLDNTLDFGVTDSGKNGHRVYYRGEEGNMPIVSGGFKVSGFEPTPDKPGIWQVRVDGVEQIRQLYVNEKKARRASSTRTVTAVGSYNDPNTSYDTDGMYMSKDYIDLYKNAEDMEFQWAKEWVTTICKVDSIVQDPANQQQVIVKMKQSWWNLRAMESDGTHGPKPYLNFTMNNAMELLDVPGEFYYNKKTKILYYMPQADEDITSATVIVPRLEKIVRIIGDDVTSKVENLTLEGIKFAHATWYAPGTDGIKTRQQQGYLETSDLATYLPGAIELNRVKNVELKDNYFFGFGSTGVDLVNSATNTLVDGNAFSDIGDAAVVSGRDWHGKQHDKDYLTGPPPSIPPSQVNLIDGTQKVATSYYGRTATTTMANLKNARSDIVQSLIDGHEWLSEADYKMGSTWYNDPYAPAKGEKSWVRFDFDKAYTFSKIKLAFAPVVSGGGVTSTQRSKFEVLLSNDKFFTPGNYDVVATQNTAAADYQDYLIPTALKDKKYRFILIRTLGATDFALSRAWAFTPDKKLYTRVEINKNNTISNNYIRRAGDEIAGGGGISGFYNVGLNIVHNDIIDITYSGIALGWGWQGESWTYGSSANNISNNYISNTNLTLLDGAGIYTLGDMPDTVISGNYIDSPFQGNGAIYTDSGTDNVLVTDNVCEDSLVSYMINVATEHNVFKNLYTTHDFIYNKGEANSTVEPVKVYLPGNPPSAAYSIMKNAGIGVEYSNIRSLVYDMNPNMADERQRYADLIRLNDLQRSVNAVRQVADNILKNGSFGGLPEQYPTIYKFKLTDAVNSLDSASTSTKLDRFIDLRHLLVEIGKSVKHKNLEDMVAFCEEKLQTADVAEFVANVSCVPCIKLLRTAMSQQIWDVYPVSGPQALTSKLTEVKSQMTGTLTDQQKYELVIQLEESYHKFEISRSSADIDYVNLDGALSIDINKGEKKVTAEFPIISPLTDTKLTIIPYGVAQVGTAAKSVDLNNKSFEIPMFSPSINKFLMWTLVGQNDSSPNVTRFDSQGWVTKSGKSNSIVPTSDGSVILAANPLPYMNTNCSVDGQAFDFSFKPVTANSKNDFAIIFGAQSGEQFLLEGAGLKDDRYEIQISNTTANLYSFDRGVKKLLSTQTVPVSYSSNNSMRFMITKEGSKSRLQVWVNSQQIFNNFSDLVLPQGHMGFYSATMGIKVLNN